MNERPMCPDCPGMHPSGIDGEFPFSSTQKGECPDCANCVYFSNRNCGRDTGPDHMLFDQLI